MSGKSSSWLSTSAQCELLARLIKSLGVPRQAFPTAAGSTIKIGCTSQLSGSARGWNRLLLKSWFISTSLGMRRPSPEIKNPKTRVLGVQPFFHFHQGEGSDGQKTTLNKGYDNIIGPPGPNGSFRKYQTRSWMIQITSKDGVWQHGGNHVPGRDFCHTFCPGPTA